MSPILIVVASLKTLQRNRLRTILTMLGIMAGIAAAICTVSLGEASASATGLIFGYYQARRASELDPVDALRFE